jgi:hypothetical protein
MASGYTSCPCCGYDTVSDDTSAPELCSNCEDEGCAEDGSSIGGPGCPCSDEDEDTDVGEMHRAGDNFDAHNPGTLGGICPICTADAEAK